MNEPTTCPHCHSPKARDGDLVWSCGTIADSLAGRPHSECRDRELASKERELAAARAHAAAEKQDKETAIVMLNERGNLLHELRAANAALRAALERLDALAAEDDINPDEYPRWWPAWVQARATLGKSTTSSGDSPSALNSTFGELAAKERELTELKSMLPWQYQAEKNREDAWRRRCTESDVCHEIHEMWDNENAGEACDVLRKYVRTTDRYSNADHAILMMEQTAAEMKGLKAALQQSLSELAAARAEVDDAAALNNRAVCTYCGTESEKSAEGIIAHVMGCAKHPMKAAWEENQRLTTELQEARSQVEEMKAISAAVMHRQPETIDRVIAWRTSVTKERDELRAEVAQLKKALFGKDTQCRELRRMLENAMQQRDALGREGA